MFRNNRLSRRETYKFENDCAIDVFYINVHNMAFNEALLIIVGLLNKPESKDKRVINLWNYGGFVPEILNILKAITKDQSFINLTLMRDQVIAHQDISNKVQNMFPRDRIISMVSSSYVHGLEKICSMCIKAYCINNPNNT